MRGDFSPRRTSDKHQRRRWAGPAHGHDPPLDRLAACPSGPWSNNACRGYVIYAMENCGFSPQDIRRVVAELYEVFDIRGLEEAQQHYERSPY